MVAVYPALTSSTPDSVLVPLAVSEALGESIRSRALGLLFARHDLAARSVIQRIFRQSCLVPVDAEDVLQEAHVKAAGKLHTLREPEAFGPWLRAIARNEATSTIRALLSRRYYDTGPCDAEPRGMLLAALLDWPDGGEDSLIGRLDAERWLMRALAHLPKRAFTALLLAYVEGQSHDAIAQQLGVPIGTIGSDLCRARQAIRRRREIP